MGDGLRIVANVSADGLDGGIQSRVRDFQRPDTVGREGIERELPELSLREGFRGGTYPHYLARPDGVDATEREVKGIAHLGGVYLVRHIDGTVRRRGCRRFGRVAQLVEGREVVSPVQ